MIPTRKVNVGALAGGIVLLLVWLSKAYGKVDVPAEIAMTLTTLITYGVQWAVADPKVAAIVAEPDAQDTGPPS